MADGDQTELKKLRNNDTEDESADRLSNLPVEILYSILAGLATVEVVRTCVLLKSWRNIWVTIPYLNFDLTKYDDGYSFQREWFWKFMESVLRGRNGKHVIKRLHFYIRFYIGERDEEENFQSLLRLAAMQSVEELDICTYGVKMSYGKLSLSRHLSESLKILEVNARLDISLRAESDFSNLRSLYLRGINSLHNDTINKLSFDTLEDLHLENCYMEEVTVVDISAPNLKKFTFVDNRVYFDDEDDGLQLFIFLGELKIWAPKLAYFYYSGPVLTKFTIDNLSSLIDARIYLSPLVEASDHKLDLPFIIRELFQVKRLTLSASALLYFSDSERSCEFDMLPNLISLRLDIQLSPWKMDQLLYLLKLSPRLQTLTITLQKSDPFHSYLYELDHQWKLLEWDIECLRNSLEVVKLYEFIPLAMEIEMVELLLQHAKVLDRMHIVSRKPVPFYIKPDSVQKSIQKIQSFPKSSGKASVYYN